MLESQFGKYRIEGVAGVGGMSVVYRAYDESLDRIVALKVLNIQSAADDTGLRRFQREVQIAQRLNHPHIVKLYETGEIDNRAYLAMAYMERGSLAGRFAKPTPVTLGVSAELLSEIASALDYAHANGIVHRDLKLENVLLSDEGHIALSDFGIAQILNVSSLTETGQSFGTPLYVSPEQLRGAKTVDFRTDLYSLGVIAYLLATGYFPFSGESGVAILHRHLTQEPPLPSNLNPRLPAQMDWVLRKSLAKNPQDRFASAGALAEAFAAAISHIPDVEVVILASQPTPLVGDGNSTPNKLSNGLGGSDTVPIGEMIASRTPHRFRSAFPFRIAMGVAILALISIVLLGRVLTPPQDGNATQPETPNFALVETESTATGTPTQTMTATPSPTQTRTRTPTATSSSTRTPTDTPSPTRTPTETPSPTRTPTDMRTPTETSSPTRTPSRTPSPTRTPTRTPSRTASPTRTATNTAQMLVASPSPTRQPTTVPATQSPPTPVPPTNPPPTSVPPTNPPPPPTDPPPTEGSILDPIIPPIVPTLLGGLLGG